MTAAVVMCAITLPFSKRLPPWTIGLLMLSPPLYYAVTQLRSEHFALQVSQVPSSIHSIERLYLEGRRHLEDMVSRQSKSVEEALVEYRRRYDRDPPRGFEQWVEIALRKGLVLIDEFDGPMRAFKPYGQLEAPLLEATIESAIAHDRPGHLPFRIENGEVRFDGGNDNLWFGEYISGWLKPYQSFLPNMTLIINSYDEPGVVVPHDILDKAVDRSRAHETVFSEATGSDSGVVTDLLHLERQHPWSAMTLSCPVSSPARQSLRGSNHNKTAPEFIFDTAASKDLCEHYEYSKLHSTCNSPASMGLYQSLVPLLTQGKFSSFQDILYPSPYY